MNILNNTKIPFAILTLLLLLFLFGKFIYNKPIPKSVNIPENTAPENPVSPISPSKYHFPISDYDSRIRYKPFGKYFNGTESLPACGRQFTGFHVADDLEINPGEEDIEVQVYAANEGMIREVSEVSGYGGLLIMETILEGQDVTLNYGHISLSSVKFKVGEKVKSGDVLANLGKGCSTETGGERKHLHFAIRKGNQIDVAGYVKTESELANWLNPKEELAKLGAK